MEIIFKKMLDTFKMSNPILFAIVAAVILVIYGALQTGVINLPEGMGFVADYLPLLLGAFFGSKTVSYLPDDLEPCKLQEWLAKLIDAFKANNASTWAIIQIVLIGVYAFATQVGPVLGISAGVLESIIMVLSLLVGGRTGDTNITAASLVTRSRGLRD